MHNAAPESFRLFDHVTLLVLSSGLKPQPHLNDQEMSAEQTGEQYTPDWTW